MNASLYFRRARWARFLIGLFGALLLAAIPAIGRADDTVKLAGLSGGASEYPVFVAVGLGFFKEQGIDVQSIAMQNAGQLIAPLATGQLDVGSGSDSAAFFNGVRNGVDVRIVADKGTMMKGLNYQGLVIRKSLIDSGKIGDYKDLKGHKFAISGHGVTTEYLLDNALKRGGLTLNDVKTVTMRFPEMFAALSNGSIDGAILGGPLAQRASEKGVAVMWRGSGDLAPGHHISLVLFSPKFVEERPDVARRYMVAYMKGVRAYHDAMFDGVDKDRVVKILMQAAKIKDPKLISGTVPITVDQNLTVNRDAIVWDQDWYAAHGYVKTKIDVNKVIDTRFVDYAIKKLGRR
jgi:ABC-type nitrate/sulfonate/bicarbonate transport system substrate-binding protein